MSNVMITLSASIAAVTGYSLAASGLAFVGGCSLPGRKTAVITCPVVTSMPHETDPYTIPFCLPDLHTTAVSKNH